MADEPPITPQEERVCRALLSVQSPFGDPDAPWPKSSAAVGKPRWMWFLSAARAAIAAYPEPKTG